MGAVFLGLSARSLSGFSALAVCGTLFLAPACGDSNDDDKPAGSSSGSGGSGGSSGSTGKGGTTGSGGSAGKGGSTGQGGTTGGSSSTGSGGDSGGETSVGGGGAGGSPSTNADLSCLGNPLPAAAEDPITITGTIVGLSATGLADATVAIHATTGGAALDSHTTIAGGAYDLSVATGNDPLSAYLHVSKTDYWDSYLDPGRPLVAALEANLPLITAAQVAAGAVLADETQTAGSGLVVVFVRDCAVDPIEGAIVTSDSGATVRYANALTPDTSLTATSATGTALFFDLEPGDITVNAEAGGETLRAATTTVYADSVTIVGVGP